MSRINLQRNLLVFALATFFLKPSLPSFINRIEDATSNFSSFSRAVQGGEGDVLRGVYVANVLALPVVQQPADQPYYVSTHDGELTQFSIASQYGNIGLLAHNELAGRFFSQFQVGQEVRLVYGNGRVEYFVITQLLRFQALQPESISSRFRNLDRDEVISAGEMFNRAYVGEHRLVFQTCIEAEGEASWGRLFVIAIPKK